MLAPGWREAKKVVSAEVVAQPGMVVEDAASGWCGAVTRWENGLVVLEDRKGRGKAFPFGPGFLLDGKPVVLKVPARPSRQAPTHTASGSRVAAARKARVAAPSRIYVEGTHDAELVEKVWGDDLRHVGVVVEPLHGIDDLAAIVQEFGPSPKRRLGVLVDHLVPGTKESRIVADALACAAGDHVLVTGHEYIDIWQAVKPATLGIPSWPDVPRGVDWKTGTCGALGWPHASPADLGGVWRAILAKVSSWEDLDRRLVTEVERLIDFTQDI